MALVLVICTFFTSLHITAYAENAVSKFEESNVLDDLKSANQYGQAFDFSNYPFNETLDVKIVTFVEYCYSYKVNLRENYGLFLYIYNPKGLEFSDNDKLNRVEMAVSYDEEGKPNRYEKFSLDYCNKAEEGIYKNLFYKFKVVDREINGKTFAERVNSNLRRYDIAGVELGIKGSVTPIEYGVGGTYLYSGYAKGYGPDKEAESTLNCEVKELETVKLEVHNTFFRTGEYKENYRHDLTSVYFAVPNKFVDKYGKLQKIKAEWFEYETTPICVTSNNEVYNLLSPYIGQSTTESTGNILQLYTGYQQLTGPSGHYDKYDWAYNCNYTFAVSKPCFRISYLFSTNGEKIGNYVLSRDRLQKYIEEYNKSFATGTLKVPGKEHFSHDLFEKTLSDERAKVNYVGEDIHHKLVEFDTDDTFDMFNYEDANDGWYKFFAGLFGKLPNDMDESYKGVSPIHIVTEDDMKKDNLARHLLIDGKDERIEEFRDFYDTSVEEDKQVVLFRFAQTDYLNLPVMAYKSPSTNLSGNYGKDTFIAQETVFLNFDIIELTFNKEGSYTVIPVVNNPIDIYNDLTFPELYKDLAWWQILLAVLVLLLVLYILGATGILRLIFRLIIWIILLPFNLVRWIVSLFTKRRRRWNGLREL